MMRITPIFARKESPSIVYEVKTFWFGMYLIKPSRMPAINIPTTCGRPSFLPSSENNFVQSRISASGSRISKYAIADNV